MVPVTMVPATTVPATTGGDDGSADDGGDDDSVDLTQGGDLTFHMITHSEDGPFWSVVKRGMPISRRARTSAVTVCLAAGLSTRPTQMVQDIEGRGWPRARAVSPPRCPIPALRSSVRAPGRGWSTASRSMTLNSGANDYQEIGALTHVGQTEFIAGQAAGERFNEAGATHVLCAFSRSRTTSASTERCEGLEDTFSGDGHHRLHGPRRRTPPRSRTAINTDAVR